MTFTLLVCWALDRIEVVHMSHTSDSSGKHMTSVTESDLSAILQGDACIVLNTVTQNIHQQKFVTDCCNNMESTRMECNRCRFFSNRSLVANLIFAFLIVPDHDVGSGASYDKLLA